MVPDSSPERDKLGILQLVDNTTREQLPFSQTFTSLHRNISMRIFHSVLYICYGTDQENLFNNQQLLYMAIISLILITLMCDSAVMP